VAAPPVSRLEALIPELMREAAVPGLSMAVVKDGRVLWCRGFGVRDAASGDPVDGRTVFEAASVSKTVFAYAALKLCDRRVIDLDTPLTRYAPRRFLQGDPRLERITARHVLSHTAGFQDWRSGDHPLRIHFMPGERFLYSGEGYHYLQSTISHLTGRMDPNTCAAYEAGLEVCGTDFDSYMKQNLLDPFGMASSGYVWTDAFEDRAARPHDASGRPLRKSRPTAADAARYGAAGGLHTTAADYARFLVEVLAPRDADAFRLERNTLAEMLRPQVKLPAEVKIDGATSWALGWAVREHEAGDVVVHSGGQSGFKALAVASPAKGTGFIALTNGDSGWKVFHDARFVEAVDPLVSG
jgi:CubicO group peptidase (beta-lactamase class C family)